MDRSRKVILVITPSFARNKYCDYELMLTGKISLERALDVFVPIFVEPTEAEDMAGLLWIKRKLAYFTWPRDENQELERAEFWEKLRDALSDHGLSIFFQDIRELRH